MEEELAKPGLVVDATQIKEVKYQAKRLLKEESLTFLKTLDDKLQQWEEDSQQEQLKISGFDWGCKDLLTSQTGEAIPNPKFMKQFSGKIAKRQRNLSKAITFLKQVTTAFALKVAQGIPLTASHIRYIQAIEKKIRQDKVALSKLWKDLYHVKEDFLHKLSLKLVKENDILFMEKLSTQQMVDYAPWSNLVKAILDSMHSKLINYCSYKAIHYGKLLWLVNPKYTSMTCSECREVNYRLQLKDKSWQCSQCGEFHHRDHNAAKNITTRGLAGISGLLLSLFGSSDPTSQVLA